MQIFYRNSTDEILQPLEIPKCGQNCSLETFRRVYADIIPTDTFEEECGLPFYLDILEGNNICLSSECKHIFKFFFRVLINDMLCLLGIIGIICVLLMVPIMSIVLWKISARKRGNIVLEADNNMKYL